MIEPDHQNDVSAIAAMDVAIDPSIAQLLKPIGLLLKNVNMAVLRSIDANMAPLDLTAMQWAPIIAIADGVAKTAADLATLSSTDNGAVTRMLDRLQSKGLITRERSTQDRRVVNLALTEAGQKIAQMIPLLLRKSIYSHLQDFSVEELKTLTALLMRMLEPGQMSSQAAKATSHAD